MRFGKSQRTTRNKRMNMFKDYYEILEVGFGATDAEVKSAYQKQAAKWHAGRDCGCDVSEMISISEAYEILGNPTTRAKYNREYLLFKQVMAKATQGCSQARTGTYSYDYQVNDDDLSADIRKAHERASSMVSNLMSQLKSDVRIAAEGAWENCKYMFYLCLFATLVAILIFAFGAV